MFVHQSEILVGDLVIVDNGMEIPADGFLIESSEITTDESAMTGETMPMKKNVLKYCIEQRNQILADNQRDGNSSHEVASPVLLSGSKVLSGEGKMVALAVGKLSAIGKIQNILSNEDDNPTPLQQKLEHIAEDIGKFGLLSAIIIFLVLIIRLIVDEQRKVSGWGDTVGGEIVRYLIISITVVVVAIPEGLPLAVTLSLAFSVKKMLYD